MRATSLKRAALAPGVALTSLLGGCTLDLLDPKGSVGAAEKSLIVTASWAMLIVVIPVIVLTLLFAWRYRERNHRAEYRPKWAHSTAIEIVIWTVPSLIILFLAVLTWNTTHALDPYKPLESDVKPITVQVVALDWKWLFIYPELGIATVNQIAFPVDTPVNFVITSDSVMNSFFIPQLGSQIYAMAGMQTRLHLIANQTGDYAGMSANYSGAGFSDMTFRTLATTPDAFDAWVAKVRASPDHLDMNRYNAVSKREVKAPVGYFSSVDPNLFRNVVARYNNGNVLDLTDANCEVKK
ncbi:ubiquinol oxidase subunit II [Paraburkholderia sp.]|uniref:ubiquinol oxidase subunit II n=1 Tax=Paraburkholderia sp. TaxID=1926495 RepID=UPI002385E306|nr:ubiquinol oxidase subunit II [Paraburkholderia sp.]MDE1179809.1 ubiquinol oxidase subunit II [Paraburkholderia sp.]